MAYTKTLAAAVISSLLLASPSVVAAKTLYSVVDLSDSAAPAVDQNVANQIARQIAKDVRSLEYGDRVKIRSLGSSGTAIEQVNINVELSKKLRPRKAAKQLAQIAASFPKRVENGTMALEPSTNIIGFLEALSPSLDCSEPTVITIYTDAIEYSELVDGNDLLSGAASLPSPSGRILDQCEVIFRGVGQQQSGLKTSPTWFPNLKKAWAGFMQEAGVQSFKAYAYYGD